MTHPIARRPVAQRVREWLIARCLAPINLDGSQVSEVTIDGQSVSAVTMDGDEVFGGAIPDTLLSRTDDDSSFDTSTTRGIVFRTNDYELDGIKARISANSSGATTAYLLDSSYATITTTDISGLSAGDSFSLNVSTALSTETQYVVATDADGSNWTLGYRSGALSSEITGDAFDLVTGYDDGTTDDVGYAVNDFRNLDY